MPSEMTSSMVARMSKNLRMADGCTRSTTDEVSGRLRRPLPFSGGVAAAASAASIGLRPAGCWLALRRSANARPQGVMIGRLLVRVGHAQDGLFVDGLAD